jgi:hypothetical protein
MSKAVEETNSLYELFSQPRIENKYLKYLYLSIVEAQDHASTDDLSRNTISLPKNSLAPFQFTMLTAL